MLVNPSRKELDAMNYCIGFMLDRGAKYASTAVLRRRFEPEQRQLLIGQLAHLTLGRTNHTQTVIPADPVLYDLPEDVRVARYGLHVGLAPYPAPEHILAPNCETKLYFVWPDGPGIRRCQYADDEIIAGRRQLLRRRSQELRGARAAKIMEDDRLACAQRAIEAETDPQRKADALFHLSCSDGGRILARLAAAEIALGTFFLHGPTS